MSAESLDHAAIYAKAAAGVVPLGIPVLHGLRAAIDATCKDCIYDPLCGGGSWRMQVAKCSAITCPLWPVRPAPREGALSDPPRNPNHPPPGWTKWAIDSPDFESAEWSKP